MQNCNEASELEFGNCFGTEDNAVSSELSPPGWRKQSRFFLRFGFTPSDWQRLAEALLGLAQKNEVIESEQTRHGIRYVVDGTVAAPNGTILKIRTA